MGTITNSEDPNEMPHKVTFHQGMHCLSRQNRSSEKTKYIYIFLIITCNPSIYTMDHPDLTVSYSMENSIDLKRDCQIWLPI